MSDRIPTTTHALHGYDALVKFLANPPEDHQLRVLDVYDRERLQPLNWREAEPSKAVTRLWQAANEVEASTHLMLQAWTAPSLFTGQPQPKNTARDEVMELMQEAYREAKQLRLAVVNLTDAANLRAFQRSHPGHSIGKIWLSEEKGKDARLASREAFDATVETMKAPDNAATFIAGEVDILNATLDRCREALQAHGPLYGGDAEHARAMAQQAHQACEQGVIPMLRGQLNILGRSAQWTANEITGIGPTGPTGGGVRSVTSVTAAKVGAREARGFQNNGRQHHN